MSKTIFGIHFKFQKKTLKFDFDPTRENQKDFENLLRLDSFARLLKVVKPNKNKKNEIDVKRIIS
jgi:hypothetical protein